MDSPDHETAGPLGSRSCLDARDGLALAQRRQRFKAGLGLRQTLNGSRHCPPAARVAMVAMVALGRAAGPAPWRRWLTTAAMALGAGLSVSSVAWATPLAIVVRDAHGAAVADAVVSVEVNGQPSSAPPGTLVQMAQRNKAFDPPLLPIQTGTAVNFPNLDTVRHHVYSFSAVHPFELKLYAGVPAKPVLFDKPGVASLGCNIHDRMSAYIVVVSTPIFARTNEQGQASVEVPDGQHVLQTWHLSMGDAGAPIRQSIKVGAGVATRVTVTLPNGFGAHAL